MNDVPNDMSCQDLIELVTEYIEGTLPAAERARLEEHLGVCVGCRNYLDQMRRTIELMGTLEAHDIPDDAKEHLLRAFRTWKQSS